MHNDEESCYYVFLGQRRLRWRAWPMAPVTEDQTYSSRRTCGIRNSVSGRREGERGEVALGHIVLNDSPPASPANEVAYTPPTDATVIPPYTPTKMPLPSNAPPPTSSSSRSPTRVPSSREEPVLAPSQRLTPPTPSCPLTDLDFQNMNNRSDLVITSPSRALSSTRSHRGLRESM